MCQGTQLKFLRAMLQSVMLPTTLNIDRLSDISCLPDHDSRAEQQKLTRQLYPSLTDSATEAFFQNISSMNIMADAFCLT